MVVQKRHNTQNNTATGDSSSTNIPVYRNNDQQNNKHDGGHDLRSKLARGKALFPMILITISFIAMKPIIFSGSSSSGTTATATATATADSMSRYGPLLLTNNNNNTTNNNNNKFISAFEKTLINNDLRREVTKEGYDHGVWVPLLIDNKKGKQQLLCRRKHKEQLFNYRTRFFTQMVSFGLQRREKEEEEVHNNSSNNSIDSLEDGLPILVMEGDMNGCIPIKKSDDVGFPRLTWGELSTAKFGNHCQAIGMPSYESWLSVNFYQRSHHTLEKDWERTFQQNEKEYPWSKKLDKVVWRGSSTCEKYQYGHGGLGETPRGRLVKISMEHPDLIDAGFVQIVQKFEAQKDELAKQFTVTERMKFKEMMKYKAIIDIDGNNWSSRFGMLLCSNSAVIKIDPDYTEYFYDDGGDVRPMEHYLPASIENITDVVSYVLDRNNEEQIKAIVKNANSWCKKELSEESLERASIAQLDAYREALDSSGNWSTSWQLVKQQFTDTIDDFVDCNVLTSKEWRSFFFHRMKPKWWRW